jgi:hypothetical protein
MAAGGVSSGANRFPFSLDQNLAKGVIELDPSSSPEMLAALLDPNQPLPAGDVLFIGGDLSVAPGKDIQVGPAKVGFSADANAALGVFATPASIRTAILKNADLVSQIADNLSFSGPADGQFLMLRWGYDISGTVAGSVALGPATNLSFNANAGRKGYYAIVQSVAAGAKARASIESLVKSWKLPSQVREIGDLPAGATLISEVDASFAAGATITFGYDFNWLRAVDGLGLKGDVGLKLKTGLSASIGFGLSGKYGVVLSRDAALPTVQMRLYKLRVSQWNFGFDASLTATPVTPPLPEHFDDLLKAVTGTHGQQIVKMLGRVEDWVDPNKPLFGPFVNLADTEAQQLIKSLTGVTDLAAAFNDVKGRIQKLFHLWDNLPQTVTQLIWSKLSDVAGIAKIAGIANQVATLSPADLTKLIQNSLTNVPFLNTDEGKALEALAVNGLFSALQGTPAQQAIQKAAGLVGQILDGSALQSLLTKLQAAVGAKLDLKKLETVVDQTTFDSLDSWLKARLEDFLEEKLVGAKGVAELQKLRAGLKAILDKKDELYAKALAALKKTYSFDLNATYQSSSTTSALLDVTFDFGAAGSGAATGLQLALGGKFDQLLGSTLAGVTINDGVLAFALHKESHVSLTLPYFSTQSAHVNDAVAQLKTVNEDAGGLIFSLTANDLYTVKNDYSSGLAITLGLPAKPANVRLHSPETATYDYDLKVAAAGLTSPDLAQRYDTYANTYFATEFQKTSPGTFADWANQIAPPSHNFGNTLISLKLSLPSSALLPWLSAPESNKDMSYKRMSMALQSQFKQVLHDSFFSDVHRYKDVSDDTAARAVLVFCAIPACSDAKLVNNGDSVQFLDEKAGGDHIYWDYRDRGVNIFGVDLREKVLFHPDTVRNLKTLLSEARARIQASNDPDRVLDRYGDDQAGAILKAVLGGQLIGFLFPVEGNMVEEARNAGLKMAAFRKHQFSDPEQARKDLAKFGQKLSEDFNSNLKTFAVGNALLPLGTAVYTAAATSLGATAPKVAAMFTIRVIKDGAAFPPPGLEPASEADVLRTERVVHAG